MYSMSRFLLLSSLVLPYVDARTINIQQADPVVTLLQTWQTLDQQAVTSSPGEVLKVTLPQSATSLVYVGAKRQTGAVYGLCIDCDTENRTLDVVDGTDGSLPAGAFSSPMPLFTRDLDPSASHVLTVINMPDNRSPSLEANVAFMSLIVNVPDSSTSAPSQATPITTSVASSTSSTSSPILTTSTPSPLTTTNPSNSISSSTTTNESSPTPSASSATIIPQSPSGAASKMTLSQPMIIGIACIGGVALVALVIGLLFCLHFRRRRRNAEHGEMSSSGANGFVSVLPPPSSNRLSKRKEYQASSDSDRTQHGTPPLSPARPVHPFAHFRPTDMPLEAEFESQQQPTPPPSPRSPRAARPVLGFPHYSLPAEMPVSTLRPAAQGRPAPYQEELDVRPDSWVLPREATPSPPPMALDVHHSLDLPAPGFTERPRSNSLTSLPARSSVWLGRKVNYDINSRPGSSAPVENW